MKIKQFTLLRIGITARNKSNVQKLLLFAILTLLMIIILFSEYQDGRDGLNFLGLKKIEITLIKKKIWKIPLIVAWTQFFGHSIAINAEDALKQCDCQCTVTDDKRAVASADAVIFHIRDLNIQHLPENRSSDQFYIFFLLESPANTGMEKIPKDFFNLSMTYRRDSDILIPYGMLKKIDGHTSKDQIWDWEEVQKIANSKTEMVLQLVSSCNTNSKRREYVNELKLFVNVTQRGSCNRMPCNEECARELRASHRFYLAFENSVCRDYVTEKVFRNMEELLVPIVLKRSVVSEILPLGSYIAADDFASPSELADYLDYLQQNATAYLRYLEWTKHYQKSTKTNLFCSLCKYFHEHVKSEKPKVIQDIYSWWYDGGQCVENYASRLTQRSEQLPP